MSSGPSLYVSIDISRRAEKLINVGSGDKIREGVELLLQNDVPGDSPAPGTTDAGRVLQRGLALLASSPYEALGIAVGCKTIDVRKAYKKMALKYHPDKNPKTTPLFQAIQTASDKLTDAQSRRNEEAKASQRQSAAPSAAPTRAPPAAPAAAPPPPSTKYADPGRNGQKQPTGTSARPGPSSSRAETNPESYPKQAPERQSYKYRYSTYGDDDDSAETSSKAPPKPTYKPEPARNQQPPQTQYQQYQRYGDGKNSSFDTKNDKGPNVPKPAPYRPAPYEKQPSQPGPYNFFEAQARARNRERVRAEAQRIEEEEREANRIRMREYQLREELKKEKEKEDIRMNERREYELKKQREREALRARQERTKQEELLIQKQREELERQRDLEIQLERQRRAEAAEARRRAREDIKPAAKVEPTATPDEDIMQAGRKWGDRHYSNVPLRKYNNAGVRNKSSSSDDIHGKETSYPLNPDGSIRSTTASAEENNSTSKAKKAPPGTPLALRCIAHDSSSAELAWSIPQYAYNPASSALLTELSWKNASTPNAMWEFAPQLISGSQVRKKNLSADCVYEFKVRTAFLPRGRAVPTDRIVSPWSKSIIVMTASNKKPSPIDKTKAKIGSPLKGRLNALSEEEDDDTGKKLSESVRRAWYRENEAESVDSGSETRDVEEEFKEYVRKPSFHLGRTMFGKGRAPSPEPEEVDSDSGDDGKYIAKKATPTSSATKPTREARRGEEFDNLKHLREHSKILEEEYEDVLDETESSMDDRAERCNVEQVDEKDVHVFEDLGGDDDKDENGEVDDDFFAGPSGSNFPGVDIWHEFVDNNGNIYYYNEKTKESEWTAPEWVEETDEQSGARYYVHLNRVDANPLSSTWSKPKQFSKIVRNRNKY